MKFVSPKDTLDLGTLFIEPGDPSINAIRLIFKDYGLELIESSDRSFRVTIDPNQNLFKLMYICLISFSTYIDRNGRKATNEINGLRGV